MEEVKTDDFDLADFLPGVAKRFCPQCGEAVSQNGRGRPKKFCSQECSRLWWKAHPKPEHWKSAKWVECVICSMKVLTHMGRWREVTATGSKLGETVILKGNHYGLECTPNHPIYSADVQKYYPQLGDGKRGNVRLIGEEKQWTPAEEMQGKLWCVPLKTEYLPMEAPHYSGDKHQKPMPAMNEDFFYFVGRWLGDGWIRNTQRSGRPKGQRWGQIVLCDSLDKEGELRAIVEKLKEMREKTNGEKPRWICWENVPGALSSNKCADFKAVLEAVIGVVEPGTEVPAPEKKGWANADYLVGDGWSLAYRILDAQGWGVPQRRARIFLVADFASQSAPKVLFESEGLSGYTPQGFRAWQGAAGHSENCSGTAGGADERSRGDCGGRGVTDALAVDGYNSTVSDKAATIGVNCGMSTGRNGIVLNDQGGNRMDVTEEVTCTLRAEAHHPPLVLDEPSAAGFCTEHSANARSIGYEEETSPTLRAGVVPAAIALENHPTDSRVKISEEDISQTLTSRMGTGGNNVPLVMEEELPAQTLKIRSGCEGGGKGPIRQVEKSATLGCNNDQTVFVPFVKGTRPHSAEEAPTWKEGEVANTLNTYDVGETRCNELAVKAYGICSKASHSMMSDNPHSGFYEAETSRTLDANGGNPNCNQGGTRSWSPS